MVEESMVKTVKNFGNGAMVNVPKSWIGKQVKVTLLEEPKYLTKEQIKFLIDYIDLGSIPKEEIHQLDNILENIPDLFCNTFCLNCCDNPTKNCKDKDVIPTDCKTCHKNQNGECLCPKKDD